MHLKKTWSHYKDLYLFIYFQSGRVNVGPESLRRLQRATNRQLATDAAAEKAKPNDAFWRAQPDER